MEELTLSEYELGQIRDFVLATIPLSGPVLGPSYRRSSSKQVVRSMTKELSSTLALQLMENKMFMSLPFVKSWSRLLKYDALCKIFQKFELVRIPKGRIVMDAQSNSKTMLVMIEGRARLFQQLPKRIAKSQLAKREREVQAFCEDILRYLYCKSGLTPKAKPPFVEKDIDDEEFLASTAENHQLQKLKVAFIERAKSNQLPVLRSTKAKMMLGAFIARTWSRMPRNHSVPKEEENQDKRLFSVFNTNYWRNKFLEQGAGDLGIEYLTPLLPSIKFEEQIPLSTSLGEEGLYTSHQNKKGTITESQCLFLVLKRREENEFISIASAKQRLMERMFRPYSTFSYFSEGKEYILFGEMTRIERNLGRVVFKKGDDVDGIYLLNKGTIEVSFKPTKIIKGPCLFPSNDDSKQGVLGEEHEVQHKRNLTAPFIFGVEEIGLPNIKSRLFTSVVSSLTCELYFIPLQVINKIIVPFQPDFMKELSSYSIFSTPNGPTLEQVLSLSNLPLPDSTRTTDPQPTTLPTNDPTLTSPSKHHSRKHSYSVLATTAPRQNLKMKRHYQSILQHDKVELEKDLNTHLQPSRAEFVLEMDALNGLTEKPLSSLPKMYVDEEQKVPIGGVQKTKGEMVERIGELLLQNEEIYRKRKEQERKAVHALAESYQQSLRKHQDSKRELLCVRPQGLEKLITDLRNDEVSINSMQKLLSNPSLGQISRKPTVHSKKASSVSYRQGGSSSSLYKEGSSRFQIQAPPPTERGSLSRLYNNLPTFKSNDSIASVILESSASKPTHSHEPHTISSLKAESNWKYALRSQFNNISALGLNKYFTPSLEASPNAKGDLEELKINLTERPLEEVPEVKLPKLRNPLGPKKSHPHLQYPLYPLQRAV
jgi:hypothetical protein